MCLLRIKSPVSAFANMNSEAVESEDVGWIESMRASRQARGDSSFTEEELPVHIAPALNADSPVDSCGKSAEERIDEIQRPLRTINAENGSPSECIRTKVNCQRNSALCSPEVPVIRSVAIRAF